MSQWKLSALFNSRAGGPPAVSFKPSVNIFQVFSLESWLGENQWCIWFHLVSSCVPCFINEGRLPLSNRNIFMCPSGISEQWRLHCAQCAGRNLSSGIWMQLRWVTWNNSCTLVYAAWNFIVNKKRGANRGTHLWKSQNCLCCSCKGVCEDGAAENSALGVLEGTQWLHPLLIPRWRHRGSTSSALKETNTRLHEQEIHNHVSAGMGWVGADAGNQQGRSLLSMGNVCVLAN